MNPYDFIIEKSKLEPPHKEQLINKRGLTPETISKNKFFSGGKYLLDYEQDLIKSFSADELTKSCLVIQSKEGLHLNPQLLENKVIIPYLDNKYQCYYLKPHKFALKGSKVPLYQLANIELGKPLIITEGEFKASAACQLGYNCVALPGISSYVESKFNELINLLAEYKINEVCILFDNEIKDNPEFKNYKEEPMKRYDTEYFAFIMAKKLNKENFDCRIATLPDSWMYQGKVDIDYAVSCGKNKVEFDAVLKKALPPEEYLASLTDEAKKILTKKEAKRFFRTHIKKDFGKYVAIRKKGKVAYEEIISNFTIKIIATHATINGIVRDVCFVDQFGNQSKPVSLEAMSMAGSDSFASFCYSHGNYIWRGTRDDLANIWESAFLEDDGRYIVEPDHIGYLSSEKMWLFGNISIYDNKEEMRPDKSHIFWTDKKGIKPVPITVTTGRTAVSEGIPYLSLKEFDVNEVRERLEDTIGKYEAALCLGWVSAVLYLEQVFGSFGCFPFLFVTGRRGSGKSTVAEWLMNFYGLENAGKQANDTTSVGIQRYLSYYSSLPVFIDEYRNTKDIVRKNGLLRNCYNRQSAGKGIKADFGIREAKIRGTILLSGEETPNDNALLTRCIVVNVMDKQRKENHLNWFMANRTKFSYHIVNMLRNKNPEQFMSLLNASKEYFMLANKTDDRTAINYAVVASGYAMAFPNNKTKAQDFAVWMAQEAQRAQESMQEEQPVSVFFSDLLSYKSLGLLRDLWDHDLNDNKIYVYFNGLYMVWAREHRSTHGIEPFKANAIRNYLKEEPGYLAMNSSKRINGHIRKCVVFDYDQAPEDLKMLVDNA